MAGYQSVRPTTLYSAIIPEQSNKPSVSSLHTSSYLLHLIVTHNRATIIVNRIDTDHSPHTIIWVDTSIHSRLPTTQCYQLGKRNYSRLFSMTSHSSSLSPPTPPHTHIHTIQYFQHSDPGIENVYVLEIERNGTVSLINSSLYTRP